MRMFVLQVVYRETKISVFMSTMPAGMRLAGLCMQSQRASDQGDERHMLDRQVTDQRVRAEFNYNLFIVQFEHDACHAS